MIAFVRMGDCDVVSAKNDSPEVIRALHLIWENDRIYLECEVSICLFNLRTEETDETRFLPRYSGNRSHAPCLHDYKPNGSQSTRWRDLQESVSLRLARDGVKALALLYPFHGMAGIIIPGNLLIKSMRT